MLNEELVTEIRAGVHVDENKTLLCKQNRNLIAKIASRYRMFADYEDLIQEGYIALLRAADSYEPERGAQFSTYAVYWIKQVMIRYIENNRTNVRIPSYLRQMIRSYEVFITEWKKEREQEPPDAAICQTLGISERRLEQIRLAILQESDTSIYKEIADDLTVADTLATPEDGIEAIEEKLFHEEMAAAVWEVVDSLDAGLPEVIRARYQQDLTVDQAGRLLNTTPQSIKSREAKAMRALRSERNSKKLEPFIGDIRNRALKGTGFESFMRNWASSVEMTAFKDMGIK